MASLIPTGNAAGTGSMTLSAPATNSNQTAILQDATGTVLVSGGIPAFSVYLSGNQTVSAGSFVKVAFNAKEFDTANAFDATTNNRFQPQVAGYYQFNFSFYTSGGTIAISSIAKNGTSVIYGSRTDGAGSQFTFGSMASYLIYLNGSTDYVEFFGYTATSTTFVGTNAAGACKASGYLVRAA